MPFLITQELEVAMPCTFLQAACVALLVIYLSVPSRSEERTSRISAESANGVGLQPTEEVDLADVQKLLDRQRLGYVEGFIGRVTICGSPQYSSVIGVTTNQVKSIAELADAVELRPNLVESVIAESVTSKDGRKQTATDDLIADVKRQILLKETELHVILNDTQYRRLIAIQAHLVGSKLLIDPVVTHFCGLSDGEASALKKLAKRLQDDLKTTVSGSVSKTDVTLRYFELSADFETKALKILKEDSRARFQELSADGKVLCSDSKASRLHSN